MSLKLFRYFLTFSSVNVNTRKLLFTHAVTEEKLRVNKIFSSKGALLLKAGEVKFLLKKFNHPLDNFSFQSFIFCFWALDEEKNNFPSSM